MAAPITTINQIAIHLREAKDNAELFNRCKEIFRTTENFEWVDSKSVTFAIEIFIDACVEHLKTELNKITKAAIAEFQQLVDGCGRDVTAIDNAFHNYQHLLGLKVVFKNASVDNCVTLVAKDAERFGIKNAGKIYQFNSYDVFQIMIEDNLFRVVARKFRTFVNLSDEEIITVSAYVK